MNEQDSEVVGRVRSIEMVVHMTGSIPTIAQIEAIEAMARLVPGCETFRISRGVVNVYGFDLPNGKVTLEAGQQL